MGLATLFSGNRGISNPILFCNPESPESPETTGVAGRCDPEVGSIATPPPFSCLLFGLAQSRSNPLEISAFPNRADIAPTRPSPVQGRVFSRPSPASPDTGSQRGCQGPTGGDEWQRKSAPRFAMHSGLAFIFLSSVPDIDVVAVPISGLIQSKSSICSYPQHR